MIRVFHLTMLVTLLVSFTATAPAQVTLKHKFK